MPNGNKPPAALRLSEPPAEPAAAQEPSMMDQEEAGGAGAGGFELTGDARSTFKDMLGHECKVGDKYTLEVTATDVTPESITFSLDNVESDYEGGAAEAETAPASSKPASAKTPAMTYA